MRDRDPEARVRADVVKLNDVKLRIGAEVLNRYQTLKGQGRTEDEARNVAVSWTAARFRQYSVDTIRRCLEDALNPPALGRAKAAVKGGHWSLPV